VPKKNQEHERYSFHGRQVARRFPDRFGETRQTTGIGGGPGIKARLQQEFVVGGFTAPKGSRKYLGAVVIGAYTGGKLRHYGYAGSGFSEKGLKDAVERMKPFFTDKSPFVNPPNIKEKIQWVQPKLICEIEYAELTADEQLRQTTFLGWRDDKKPKEIVLE
jgi:bifunctional non-homologous end joining protein LigD